MSPKSICLNFRLSLTNCLISLIVDYGYSVFRHSPIFTSMILVESFIDRPLIKNHISNVREDHTRVGNTRSNKILLPSENNCFGEMNIEHNNRSHNFRSARFEYLGCAQISFSNTMKVNRIPLTGIRIVFIKFGDVPYFRCLTMSMRSIMRQPDSGFSLITQIWHFWQFCLKLISRGFKKFQQKIKLPPVTITGLEVWHQSNCPNHACAE